MQCTLYHVLIFVFVLPISVKSDVTTMLKVSCVDLNFFIILTSSKIYNNYFILFQKSPTTGGSPPSHCLINLRFLVTRSYAIFSN